MNNTRKKIVCALLEDNVYWTEMLSRIGVSVEVISVEDLLSTHPACVIITSKISKLQFSALHNFLRRGGAIIDTRFFLKQLGFEVSRTRVTSLIADAHNICDELFEWKIDIYDAVNVCALMEWSFYDVASYQEFNGGIIGFWGLELEFLLADSRAMWKTFYTDAPRNASERVSKVSKGEIRRLLQHLLKKIFHKQGLPFITKSFSPVSNKIPFLFRIDSDFGNKQQIEELALTASKYGIKPTWFLHTEAHHEWIDFFKSNLFSDHEIASHGWKHKTYSSFEKNSKNITRSVDFLRTKNFFISGFCAPTGKWRPELSTILTKLDIQYSSEFSYIYDDIPMQSMSEKYPKARILQIPIHPICFGSLLRAKANNEEIYSYFEWIIARQNSHQELLSLYHHPTHENIDILEQIFSQIKGTDYHPMTFCEYSEFWIQRVCSCFSAYYENEILTIETNFPLSVSLLDGSKLRVEPDNIQTISCTQPAEKSNQLGEKITKVSKPNDYEQILLPSWRLLYQIPLYFYWNLRQ